MIPVSELRRMARARLSDSEVLFQRRRYDGAVYLCGYAVEIALKARICRTLRWAGYPETGREFEFLGSFKIHKLDLLLRLSGIEQKIKLHHMADWSIVSTWDPESRYKRIGTASRTDGRNMIESTRRLLAVL